MLTKVQESLIDRVGKGMQTEDLPSTAGAVIRLFGGESAVRKAELALEVAGPSAIVAGESAATDLSIGDRFLFRQSACLGGGSTEMARNIISERILGMPREFAADRDVPFSQVRQGR